MLLLTVVNSDYRCGANVRPELDQLYGFLHKIRDLLLKAGSESHTGIKYQEAIARFVLENDQHGGPIIEVGCHRGGLTAQLAFMAKVVGTHLFVVEFSQAALSHAQSLLEKLSLNTHTSYHQGTLETFAGDTRLDKKPLLLAINGHHRYGKIVEDIRFVQRLNRIPYAVAVHGFSLRNAGANEAFVEKAIYDNFGETVNLIRVGEQADRARDIPKQESLDPGGSLYWEEHGSEGVILFPPEPLPGGSQSIAGGLNPSDIENAPVGPEARKTHLKRFKDGFYERYMTGTGLDIGYSGGVEGAVPILPGAVGVGLDYPGYDGKTLPFPDNSQDYIFACHVLEHMPDYRHTIRDWHRVIKSGGHIVVIVPHQFLYEKRTCLPSAWNPDHKRFYTPGSLLKEIEESLSPNTYRIVHLRDNDDGFIYDIPPERHSSGCYEIECVIRKIAAPAWRCSRCRPQIPDCSTRLNQQEK